MTHQLRKMHVIRQVVRILPFLSALPKKKPKKKKKKENPTNMPTYPRKI